MLALPMTLCPCWSPFLYRSELKAADEPSGLGFRGYIGDILGLYWGFIGVILGLYRDTGKENGNYRDYRGHRV